jgi:hypothetical protein
MKLSVFEVEKKFIFFDVETEFKIKKVTNKMQIYRLIHYSWAALHVSGDVFAHHQEHLTLFTTSGSIHPNCCRLVSWLI